jgi:hypothetical protein
VQSLQPMMAALIYQASGTFDTTGIFALQKLDPFVMFLTEYSGKYLRKNEKHT